jgi:predicted nucleic acid-binding protein
VEDGNTAQARQMLLDDFEPLFFTPFHRLEVVNGFRLRVFRGEMNSTRRVEALRQIEHDLADGILVSVNVRWSEIFSRSEALSASYTEAAGHRAGDILHVALALETKAKVFFTFDRRQKALAKAAGLKVKP